LGLSSVSTQAEVGEQWQDRAWSNRERREIEIGEGDLIDAGEAGLVRELPLAADPSRLLLRRRRHGAPAELDELARAGRRQRVASTSGWFAGPTGCPAAAGVAANPIRYARPCAGASGSPQAAAAPNNSAAATLFTSRASERAAAAVRWPRRSRHTAARPVPAAHRERAHRDRSAPRA
jgi:hypothetical protein